jgi:multidrug efflux pump subunit AcrB
MRKIITFFIKYPLWERMIVVVLLTFGFISLINTKTSFFPEREPRIINIQLVYPGASPQEIEEGGVLKIEDKLIGVDGVERFTSVSRENSATITVEVFKGYDVEEVLQDVKNAVNSINSFPTDMEKPLIFKTSFFDFGISFAISGDVDLKTLKKYARIAEDDLRASDGVSQIEITGYPEEEIAVSLKEETLRKYNISFTQVANAIRNANFDLSSGTIRTNDEEIAIKFRSKEYYADGLKDIVVKADRQGGLIRLEDIATVEDAWEETPKRSYLNGKNAVVITVSKTLEEDILEVNSIVKSYLKEFESRYDFLEVEVIRDSTKSLRQRIDLLTKNGAIGFILVLLSLTFFINIRLAFWVALSIPISFAGMFILANAFGLTINVISLFGMILVIGILVDDGIIIGENIYQKAEAGLTPFRAAIEGTMQVLPSVFAAIITTVTAFIPFFFLDGNQGDNMKDMAFVVIVTIVFSLLEGAFILPVHLAHSKALNVSKTKSKPIRAKLEKGLNKMRDRVYAPSLRYALRNKFLVFASLAAIVFITIGAFKGGVITSTFFPFLDRDYIDINLVMKPGTPAHETKAVLDRIEKAAWEVNEEYKAQREDGSDLILSVRKDVASSFTGSEGSHAGSIRCILLDGEERNMQSYILTNAIREKVGPVFGAEQLTYGGSMRFGKPISISLVGSELAELKEVKSKLEAAMNEMPELMDVADNDMVGLREIDFKLKEKAFSLGLSKGEISRQIRQGFYGEEVQRLQRGRDEVKIWVRYDLKDRSSVAKLEDMRIKAQDGNEYQLDQLVNYKIQRKSAVINHLDGKRVIRVDANLKDEEQEVPPVLNKIMNKHLQPLLSQYPSVRVVDDGQKREINKTATSSQRLVPLALIGMFIIIILSFRSVPQAIIVIILIPLGFIGAVWGHYFYGLAFHKMPINIMSYYGLIALMGIIVNDSIVFINTINQNLRDGLSFWESVVNAGTSRLRPILLTTITTFFGLAPLMMEKSFQAQFLIPMAISVSFGLLFATFLILILLPVIMLSLNRVRLYFWWRDAVILKMKEKSFFNAFLAAFLFLISDLLLLTGIPLLIIIFFTSYENYFLFFIRLIHKITKSEFDEDEIMKQRPDENEVEPAFQEKKRLEKFTID